MPTIVNAQFLDLAFKGFKTLYSTSYLAAPVYYPEIAMTVQSAASEESYGWIGQMPGMREWLSGERDVKQLAAHGFTIVNRKFESTVSIRREDFEDDRLGVFKPMFQEMGLTARQHPDELIFALLAQGFAELAYDGQYFFDADHPAPDKTGTVVFTSNMQDGAETPWFLLDSSRPIKPLIWQERVAYDLQMVNAPTDHQVFMTDIFHYGIRARVNAGFGLWQLAFGSKVALDADSYGAARAAMMSRRGDKGRLLGVRSDTLVVPPSLEEAGRRLLNSEHGDGGASNPWKGTAKLIVSPYLEA